MLQSTGRDSSYKFHQLDMYTFSIKNSVMLELVLNFLVMNMPVIIRIGMKTFITLLEKREENKVGN